MVLLLIVLSLESRGPRYVPLFSELDPKDAADIVARLEEQKVPYRLSGGGRTVDVPEPMVHRTRLLLAQEGLPRNGVVGLEIMDKFNLGATEFDKRVQYLRAIQGELTRTILQIDGVEAARVHLNVPEPSLFVREQKPASAAILLRLRPGAQLEPGQVRGIMHLVAGSVEGLKPENVTVLDENGKILSAEVAETADAGGAAVNGNLAVQAQFEKQLQTSVESLLEQVLGPGNVVARVRAELNFDQQTVERELFQPLKDDQGIVRSIEELQERFRGSGQPAGGVPGVDANAGIPTYQMSGSGEGEYQRTHVTRTFEINKVREQIAVAPGAVKRLSVSVVVNRNLTPQQEASIRQAVMAAVGSDPQRRDQITVVGMPFNTDLADQLKGQTGEKAGRQGAPWVKNAVVAAAGVLVMIAFLATVIRGRRRAASREEEERLARELLAQSDAAQAKAEEEARQKQAETAWQMELQAQVTALARQKPEEVAQIVRSWLSEE